MFSKIEQSDLLQREGNNITLIAVLKKNLDRSKILLGYS